MVYLLSTLRVFSTEPSAYLVVRQERDDDFTVRHAAVLGQLHQLQHDLPHLRFGQYLAVGNSRLLRQGECYLLAPFALCVRPAFAHLVQNMLDSRYRRLIRQLRRDAQDRIAVRAELLHVETDRLQIR